MEFDKSKVYTALNADESLIGAKGYFAGDLCSLKNYVECESTLDFGKLTSIADYKLEYDFNFFYLVEPAPDKWCVIQSLLNDKYIYVKESELPNMSSYVTMTKGTEDYCEQWVLEHSKKYRPFKDCDELISYFCKKHSILKTDWGMPFIWVKHKNAYTKHLIIDFGDNFCSVSHPAKNELRGLTLEELFENYIFLDGSPCGVEE